MRKAPANLSALPTIFRREADDDDTTWCVGTMLMSPKRKELQRRLGALMADVQEQRATKRRCTTGTADAAPAAEADSEPATTTTTTTTMAARASCAGAFGVLPPDLVCAVLQHLVRLSPRLRCGIELHEAAAASVRHVRDAVRTCSYLAACFRDGGDLTRLEVAARTCTSLMPTHAASDTPYLDQVMLEERSRFDVRMLESALNGLVCHCAGEHCRGVRRAHNESIAVPQSKGTDRPPTPMLSAVLGGGRRPRVKVVWPSTVDHLAAGTSVNECVVCVRTRQSTRKDDVTNSLLGLKDDPPEAFNANTELSLVRRLEVDAVDAPTESASCVDKLTVSSCGQWIALTKLLYLDDLGQVRRPDGGACLQVWHRGADGVAVLRGTLRYRGVHVSQVWFRMLDPLAPSSPVHLCLVAFAYADLEGNGVEYGLDPANDWLRHNSICQFDLENDFEDVCRRSEQSVDSFLNVVMQRAFERPSLRPVSGVAYWPDDAPAWDDLLGDHELLADSELLHVSVAASGSCVAAAVLGRTVLEQGQPPVRCAQVVFYEVPVVTRPAFSAIGIDLKRGLRNAEVQGISDLHSDQLDRLPTPRWVELSPCGDTAVVLLQAGNGEFFVHIHLRLSPGAGFVRVRRMRLEDAVRRPIGPVRDGSRAAWAEAHAWANPTVRTVPSTSIFSPCGRFLLLAFAFSQHNIVATMRSCKPGLCVLDLADVWSHHTAAAASHGSGGSGGVAWIECRADLLPSQMAWNTAGLWVLVHRGVLLLGL